MNLFTKGQKAAMRGLFAPGGPRNSFLNSNVCDGSLAEGGQVAEDSQPTPIKIKTYPNPFDNPVTITCDNQSKVIGHSLKIYNTAGKLIISQVILAQNTTLALAHLPSGIYVLKVESENGEFVHKLIKQGK